MVTPVWTEERLNQKARSALEGSRNTMFRTIKRRGLETHEIGRRSEKQTAAHARDAACGT